MARLPRRCALKRSQLGLSGLEKDQLSLMQVSPAPPEGYPRTASVKMHSIPFLPRGSGALQKCSSRAAGTASGQMQNRIMGHFWVLAMKMLLHRDSGGSGERKEKERNGEEGTERNGREGKERKNGREKREGKKRNGREKEREKRKGKRPPEIAMQEHFRRNAHPQKCPIMRFCICPDAVPAALELHFCRAPLPSLPSATRDA